MNTASAYNDSNNNNYGYSAESADSSSPFYCDNDGGGGSEDADGEERSTTGGGSKKPILTRTASLGSWERPVKSGRFSVSPVDVSIDESGGPPDIQINVDMSGDDEAEGVSGGCIAVTICGVDSGENRSVSSDDDNGSDLSVNETDGFAELPSKDLFSMGMSRLVPPQRSFRRMSSPAIPAAGLVKAPKPKANLQLKLSGNLESLDLKSSLPLSPTFFAKFGKPEAQVDLLVNCLTNLNVPSIYPRLF